MKFENMKQKSIKGSFSDLKPTLQSLKSLMESVEDHSHGEKEDMYERQERDLRNIKRNGQSNNL